MLVVQCPVGFHFGPSAAPSSSAGRGHFCKNQSDRRWRPYTKNLIENLTQLVGTANHAFNNNLTIARLDYKSAIDQFIAFGLSLPTRSTISIFMNGTSELVDVYQLPSS